jgi:hypothetical protein
MIVLQLVVLAVATTPLQPPVKGGVVPPDGG